MSDTDLPADLKAALAALAHGQSRREIGRRAAILSRHYRAGESSRRIKDEADALAYAFARLPATYAALTHVLSAIADTCPAFAPRTALDVGAGLGPASWAAARHFAGLTAIRLIDENAPLRALGLALLAASATPVLRQARYDLGDAVRLAPRLTPADLVIASYFLGELAASVRTIMAEALWSNTGAMLVIVEPGTPAGFACVAALRAQLIARGAHVVAPCPHDRACPLLPPDWCHFSQRLARSRDHRRVKSATVPYEDEKFSYVVLAREPPLRKAARVLAPPRISKAAVLTRLCTPDGIATDIAVRRDKERYKLCKTWRWGDAVGLADPSAD